MDVCLVRGKHAMPPKAQSIYCRRCQYPLVGLPANRCPECGAAFDPDDPATFWDSPKRSWMLPPLSIDLGSFFAAGAVTIIFFEAIRPHIQSAPKTICEAVCDDSLVWLALVLAVAAAFHALVFCRRRWLLLAWRLAILAFCVFALSTIVVNTRRYAEWCRLARLRAPMNGIAMAIDTFRLDVGRYPNNLDELISQPSGPDAASWSGPYLKDPKNLRDTWNRPYQYQVPGRVNQSSYDLRSLGPDGRDGTGDEIGNHTPSHPRTSDFSEPLYPFTSLRRLFSPRTSATRSRSATTKRTHHRRPAHASKLLSLPQLSPSTGPASTDRLAERTHRNPFESPGCSKIPGDQRRSPVWSYRSRSPVC